MAGRQRSIDFRGAGRLGAPTGQPTAAESFNRILTGLAGGRFTQNRPFAFRFWDGSTLAATDPSAVEPAPTFVITSPRAIAYMLRSPDEVGFGRAWIAGDFRFRR